MKTLYYTASSLDGFIADPENSLDWLLQFGEPEGGDYPDFIRDVGAITRRETVPGKDLVLIVQLHVKPERVEEWKRAVAALIDRMSQEAAFVTCLLDQSVEDPHLFTLYERWREPSLEAFITNQMKDYRKTYEDLLPGLLQTPRTAMIRSPVREWRRKPAT